MFDRILVANRGEIAVRVARTCRELGVGCVAVYSDPDAKARHVAVAEEAIALPGSAPVDTYLNVDALIAAARSSRCQAVHPGYGFLAESADFAEAVQAAGLAWIGPPPEATRAVGDKIRARRIASSAGVPVVPGLLDPVEDVDAIASFAAEHDYPVAIKAAGGGGGRGLKIAQAEDQLAAALTAARRESQSYFGSRDVYVERYLPAPKHLEVQILAPDRDQALWLGVRDCSLQRRHQKLIEESPPPRFDERSAEMGEAAVAMSKACSYVNAGTVEFLVDRDGSFYFLEVNARLQVEHSVTEEVTGLDLVACQLRIAAGEPLGVSQEDVSLHGHAIECRINAEDPAVSFAPTPGAIERYVEPSGPGVRVDSGYAQGDEVPGEYDSLIAKVITWGVDREQARRRMLRALDEMVVEGIRTTVPAHRLLLSSDEFRAGVHTTRTVEEGSLLDALVQDSTVEDENVLLHEGRAVRLWNPAMSASAAHAVRGGVPGGGELVAPMHSLIVDVLVKEGQPVAAGDPLIVLEAMKMETTLSAPTGGTVTRLTVAAGDVAEGGQVLAVVE